jgi:hypothetical protein
MPFVVVLAAWAAGCGGRSSDDEGREGPLGSGGLRGVGGQGNGSGAALGGTGGRSGSAAGGASQVGGGGTDPGQCVRGGGVCLPKEEERPLGHAQGKAMCPPDEICWLLGFGPAECEVAGGVCLPEGEAAPPDRQVPSALRCEAGSLCWRDVSDSPAGPAVCVPRQPSAACVDTVIGQEACFTREALSDPCSGVHLRSLDPPGGVAGSSGREPEGDGGTAFCPSADELYWGADHERCGCSFEPACLSPTTESDSRCCYLATGYCLLC